MYSIIYGFERPYLELAAAIIVRAVKDVRSGRDCRVDRMPCGVGNMAGVHVCAADARRFLGGDYAAELMTAVGLRQTEVLGAIGE